MRHADIAWTGLAGAVLAYEAAAAKQSWELLSTAMDRYRTRHPIVVHLTIGYLAAHLLRRWPPKFDPLHRLAR